MLRNLWSPDVWLIPADIYRCTSQAEEALGSHSLVVEVAIGAGIEEDRPED